MDESNIKIAIKNMNVWLDECHNDSDTVVMTANVLRSIRDNYCELLRCRDAIERLNAVSEICGECHKKYVEKIETAKSKAIKKFAERLKELPSVTNCEYEWFHLDIDNLLKEMEGEK